jgi:hypothetical protein
MKGQLLHRSNNLSKILVLNRPEIIAIIRPASSLLGVRGV